MTNEFAKLEEALIQAGRTIEYPATPPLAARVRQALERASAPPSVNWGARWFPRVLVPLAIAVVLALALLFALPDAREAVAQFLGLGGLRIFYVTPTPLPTATSQARATPSSTSTARAQATPVPTRAQTPTPSLAALCCEVTLQEAQAQASLKLLLPPDQSPSKVYFQRILSDGEQVVLVFGDPKHPTFTLYEAQRWVYGKMLASGATGKIVGSGTLIRETQVRGKRALWLSGAPHVVVRLDARGNPIYETARTVDANTLVWETGDPDRGTIYRLETRRSLEQAIVFAESLQEQ